MSKRPKTPAPAAIEAHERMIVFLLMQYARTKDDPVRFADIARLKMAESMGPRVARSQHAENVADLLDWMWEQVAIGVSDKGPQ